MCLLFVQVAAAAPPPYPNQQSSGIPTKRYKGDENAPNRPITNQVQPPPFYPNQQEVAMLHHLQKNKDNLNPQQLAMLTQLMNKVRMMQQHQQQLRLQQQQQQLQQQQQQQMQMSQQQITSPNMQQAYQPPIPNSQNGESA